MMSKINRAGFNPATQPGPQPYVLMHEHAGGVGLYQFNFVPSEQRPCPDERKVALQLGIDPKSGESLTLATLEGLVPTLHAKDVGWDVKESEK
jgi:hypothetical protein